MKNTEQEKRIFNKIQKVKDIFEKKMKKEISKMPTTNDIERYLDEVIAKLTEVK